MTTVSDVLDEYNNRQSSPEYVKIGINIGLISGPLQIFRNVYNFKQDKCDFEFDMKVKTKRGWEFRHVSCSGRLVLTQKKINE